MNCIDESFSVERIPNVLVTLKQVRMSGILTDKTILEITGGFSFIVDI
ncbi:MAG: hypothetical protein RSG52_04820 [Terrisporobacter sp.]